MSMMVQIILFYNHVDRIPVALAQTCPPPTPAPAECSPEERVQIVEEFDESISELKKALAEIEDEDDQEDAKSSLQEAICDTEAAKSDSLEEYDKTCNDTKVLTVLRIQRLKKQSMELNESDRRFLQEAEEETCGKCKSNKVLVRSVTLLLLLAGR